MPNLAQALKEEIKRLAKHEAKTLLSPVKKDVVRLKKFAAALKRQVATLTKDNAWLQDAEKRRVKEAPVVNPAKADKARITAKGVRAMRKKLGLSQDAFGKLVGVSIACVGLWEKKHGALRLMGKTRTAIIAIRGLGAREAKKRLEVMGK